MKNTIKAQVHFSFQGKTFSPGLQIDLDALLSAGQGFSRLHERLARANDIDTYSYAYEVMESSDIEFSEATGLASEFMGEHGQFDLPGFTEAWQTQQMQQQLLHLAQKHMKIDSLDEIEGLKQTLLAAYQAGSEKS
ncbi:MAG TPA: hypothetical protein VIQ81_13900 [Gammaproteobacteria bacterium]